MKRAIVVLFTVLAGTALLAGAPALAEDVLSDIGKRGKLLVGMEAGYLPFEMRNKQGRMVGFDVDLMKAAARAMEVEVEFVNTAWDGIIPALLTRKFDLIASGMTITQSRNLKVNFADPYIVVGQTVLINMRLKGKVKSYRDLNKPKYRLTSKLGTTGEQAVKRLIPRAQYASFETEQEAVLEVINGRADAFVYDLPLNAVMATTKGKGKVVHLDTPFTFEPLAWAIRRWSDAAVRRLSNSETSHPPARCLKPPGGS